MKKKCWRQTRIEGGRVEECLCKKIAVKGGRAHKNMYEEMTNLERQNERERV